MLWIYLHFNLILLLKPLKQRQVQKVFTCPVLYSIPLPLILQGELCPLEQTFWSLLIHTDLLCWQKGNVWFKITWHGADKSGAYGPNFQHKIQYLLPKKTLPGAFIKMINIFAFCHSEKCAIFLLFEYSETSWLRLIITFLCLMEFSPTRF